MDNPSVRRLYAAMDEKQLAHHLAIESRHGTKAYQYILAEYQRRGIALPEQS
jgi:hypothetical protein